MSLVDKTSIKNTNGARWDFDSAYLQWDTYANPKYYALTRKGVASQRWVGCSKGMYVGEWDDPKVYRELFYSRSGAWLAKDEFKTGEYQHPDVGWNNFGRLMDNSRTRKFNLI